MKRRPGDVGLNLRTGIRPALPSKISIVSPSRSCTIAFFQPGRVPLISPRRFGFACTLRMFTPSTCTSNSSSTAWRTCVRCASGWMRKTYLPSVDQAVALLRHDRREQHLVRMRGSRGPPLHVVERALAHEHASAPRRPATTSSSAGTRDERLREVAERLDQRLLVRMRDHEQRAAPAPTRRAARRPPSSTARRTRRLPTTAIVPCAAWSESAERSAAWRAFLFTFTSNDAHRRREGDAAAGELRRADRAGARAAGALLAPRLRAAARDEPARLRAARSGAVGVQLRAHGLVHEVRLDLGAEDRLLELDVLRLLARARRAEEP